MSEDAIINIEVDSATAICANHIDEIEAVSSSLTAINAVKDNAPNINIVASGIANVNKVGPKIENVNIVATDLSQGINSEIKKVNSNKTNIDRVAAINQDVSTVAFIRDHVTTVSHKEYEIGRVSSKIDAVETVSESIESVNAVAPIVSKIATVAPKVNHIEAIAPYINDVADVAVDKNTIRAVGAKLTEIENVEDSLPNIETVADTTNLTNINAVGSNIGNVNAVGLDLSQGNNSEIKKVNLNKTSIDTVASNISDVVAAGNKINDITYVKEHMGTISAVVSNENEIEAVAGDLTNIDTVATNILNINDVSEGIASVTACASKLSDIESAPANALSAASSATTATNQALIATSQAALAKQYAEGTHGASDVTVANLRASSAYRNYEYPQTDAQGLRDVKSYAHSTFDINKITQPSGSNVTIDYNGIASGFSETDYITLPPIPANTNYEIDLGAITVTSNEKSCFLSETKEEDFVVFTLGTTLILKYWAADADHIISAPITINSPVYIKMGFNGTKYYLSTSTDGKTYTTIYAEETAVNYGINPIFGIGYDRSSAMEYPYDLKQLTVVVDGVVMYNANKTGVDVIKQDYTINGSPTISADGIASGFGYANYLSKTLELTNSYNTLEIDLGEVTIDSLPASSATMWLLNAIETNSGISKGFWFGINGSGRSRFFAGSGSSNYDIANSQVGSIVYAAGQKVKFKLVYNGTQYVLYSSVNGGAWTQDGNAITSGKKLNFNTTIKIGTDGSANAFKGSLDLNTFKIIKDGEIVWQPCLKIPYMQSKTGSKIVDAAYRYRVTDMYEQYGYAPYYTLSDTDFTVPQGEIYGMIEPSKFDGDWVFCRDTDTGIELSTVVANGEHYIDLSSIFPDDGCAYEMILCSSFRHATGESDAGFIVKIYNKSSDDYLKVLNETITQERKSIQYTAIAGTRRLLSIRISTESELAMHNTNLLYYRRIGKNR